MQSASDETSEYDYTEDAISPTPPGLHDTALNVWTLTDSFQIQFNDTLNNSDELLKK